MNEQWAKDVIKDGVYNIKGRDFEIVKHSKGHCDGCYFVDKECPTKAVTMCTTGGIIFKKL